MRYSFNSLSIIQKVSKSFAFMGYLDILRADHSAGENLPKCRSFFQAIQNLLLICVNRQLWKGLNSF